MNRKTLIIGVITGISMFTATIASALTYTPPTALPMITITTDGTATVRGRVTVAPDTTGQFTITSFGKDFIISVKSLTKSQIKLDGDSIGSLDGVIPTIQKIRNTDMVGVTGKLRDDGSSLTANYVHDWRSTKEAVVESVILEGTMVGISPETKNPENFTLKVDNNEAHNITVTIVKTCKVLGCVPTTYMNYEREASTPTLWKEGDHVRILANRVYGEKTAIAVIVRDMDVSKNEHKQ